MKKIISIFFVCCIFLKNSFSMSLSLSGEESFASITKRASGFIEYERLNLINTIEYKIFPQIDLIIEYFENESLEIETIYYLWRRKINLFKKSWKKVVKNMSYEELVILNKEIEFLKKGQDSIEFKRFFHSKGCSIRFLSNIL